MNIRRLLSPPILCLGLLPVLAAPAHAGQLQRVDLPVVPSGPVSDSTLGGEGLFLGGKFTSVGPFTGSGAQLDASTGALVGPSQGFDSYVTAVAADGVGGWYVGGGFRHVAGQPAIGLVHLLADGTRDPRFDARLLPPANNVPASVDALTLAGGRLYVAGAFSSIGGGSQSVLAALDASTGTLVSRFRPTFDAATTSNAAAAFVGAVVATPDRVYAGGAFATGGRANLAAFSADTGALVTGFDPDQGATAAPGPGGTSPPRPVDTNGGVGALALTGNRLVVGGSFTTVGPSARNRLAALDATTGAVDGSFDPNADGDVDALLIDGTRLFVGGSFGFVNGRPHTHLAEISLATGIVDPGFTAQADGRVNALALTGSRLLVGGGYSTLAGAVRTGLGAVDASTGAIDAGFDPAPGRSVLALAVAQARLFAGGTFVTAGASPRTGLALLDADTGSLQGLSPQIPVKGPLGLLPGRILVADGRPEAKAVLRVRALDRQTGRLIDSFQPPDLPRNDLFTPAGNGFCAVNYQSVRCYNPRSGLFRRVARTRGRNDTLGALPIGSTLYLGGSFSRLNGKSRRSLGALDLHTGRVRAFAPRLGNHDTTLLAASPDRLYLATRGRLLALNRRTGRIVRRYPSAGFVCNGTCGLSLASGRLWTFTGSVLRVLSVRTGELLARLDLHYRIDTIMATRTRVYVGGRFGDFNMLPAPRPFLTAFDLLG